MQQQEILPHRRSGPRFCARPPSAVNKHDRQSQPFELGANLAAARLCSSYITSLRALASNAEWPDLIAAPDWLALMRPGWLVKCGHWAGHSVINAQMWPISRAFPSVLCIRVAHANLQPSQIVRRVDLPQSQLNNLCPGPNNNNNNTARNLWPASESCA